MEGYPPPYRQSEPQYPPPLYSYNQQQHRNDFPPYNQDHMGPPRNRERGGSHRHDRPIKPREIQPKPMYKQPPKVGNTIFIKNLPFRMSKDELLKIMGEYGEISNVKERISDRGFAFITYFDTRSAQKAVDSAQEITVQGRHPKIDYSYPSPSYSGLDPVTTCPRCVLSIVDATLGNQLEMSDIIPEAEKFGEIRTSSFEQGKFVVEFYNYKAAHAFVEKFNPGEIHNIRVKSQIIPEEEEAVLVAPTMINGQYVSAPPPVPPPPHPYPPMDPYMAPQPPYMQPIPPPPPQYYQTSAPIQYGIPDQNPNPFQYDPRQKY